MHGVTRTALCLAFPVAWPTYTRTLLDERLHSCTYKRGAAAAHAFQRTMTGAKHCPSNALRIGTACGQAPGSLLCIHTYSCSVPTAPLLLPRQYNHSLTGLGAAACATRLHAHACTPSCISILLLKTVLPRMAWRPAGCQSNPIQSMCLVDQAGVSTHAHWSCHLLRPMCSAQRAAAIAPSTLHCPRPGQARMQPETPDPAP